MKHLTELDLFEINDDPSVTDHIESCRDCRDQFGVVASALVDELQSVEARVGSKPDEFWARQREEIHSRIAIDRASPRPNLLRWGLLAALIVAAISLALSMVVTDRVVRTNPNDVVTAEVFEQIPIEFSEAVAYDPWESEELEPFHQALEWETWIDEEILTGGTS